MIIHWISKKLCAIKANMITIPKPLRTLSTIALLAATTACSSLTCHTPGDYHLTKTIELPGEGGWDLVAVDNKVRHVFVSHKTQVQVLDADSGKLIGKIPDLHGVHGIAVAPELKTGFITNGETDEVSVFGVNGVTKNIKVGKKPDAIVYDPATSRVFVMNAKSDSASVIDAKTLKVIRTIKLGGEPELAASDGEGHVFINLEDKNRVLKIDSQKFKVLGRWKTAPGTNPTSLAIDKMNERLFIGCRNKLLVVMDANSGKVIGKLPIGKGVDSTAYDSATRKVISSNSDGTITIIQWENGTVYKVTQTVKTQKGSHTFALDEKTHRLFVPAAEFATPATLGNARPTIVPGTFKVLVFDE